MADLTSVARVKEYAPLANTPNLNPKLTSLVSSESETLLQYLDIVCPYEQNTVRLDGLGQTRLTLPRQPVIAVSAVSILGVPLARATLPNEAGFMVDRLGGVIINGGGRFPVMPQAIECTWESGYTGRLATTLPAAVGNAPVTVTPSGGVVLGGWAAQANIIASAAGAVFTEAANAVSPAAGEFGLTDGVFYFNAADGNTPVVLTFYAVPGPLMQATNVMVSLALQQAVNIGVSYKNILGQGIRYETTQLSDDIKAIVAAYKRVVPS